MLASSIWLRICKSPRLLENIGKNIHTPPHRVHLISLNFNDSQSVDQFVQRLHVDEKQNLLNALSKAPNEGRKISVEALKFKALSLVAFSNGLPFIGFGFLDNALMILAGDSIEHVWGAAMGISTMAAAALGNWVSDVIGMGTAGYVEAVCHRIGIRAPEMTAEQMDKFSTRLAVIIGRCIGITIGCFLGMVPLLFLGKSKKDDGNSGDKNEM